MENDQSTDHRIRAIEGLAKQIDGIGQKHRFWRKARSEDREALANDIALAVIQQMELSFKNRGI
jgi:hypothetical protein